MAESEQELTSLIVEETDGPTRLDTYIASRFEGVSRAVVQRLLKEGHVGRTNGRLKASELISVGEVITVNTTALTKSSSSLTLTPAPVDLAILFEDQDLVVLDKPAGVVVHPGAGTRAPTLVEGLMYHLGGELPTIEGSEPKSTWGCSPS